jgi:hypothetical protein
MEMTKYWGYIHQGYRNLKYVSAEEQLKEMDRQYNKMIIKEFLTVSLLFCWAILVSISITVILGYIFWT